LPRLSLLEEEGCDERDDEARAFLFLKENADFFLSTQTKTFAVLKKIKSHHRRAITEETEATPKMTDPNNEEEEEEEAVQSVAELEQALSEYLEQMKELDQLDDGDDEKEEMKRELEEVIELTREVLRERMIAEGKEEEKNAEKEEEEEGEEERKRKEDEIEKELEDMENLRQIEEEEEKRRKREEEEKRWKVLKRPEETSRGDVRDETTTTTTTTKGTTTTAATGKDANGRSRKEDEDNADGNKPPKNLLYRGANDKPTYDEEGNLIIPKRLQIQDDDDKVTRDRKRKQLQTFKYKQKQKAEASEHAKRASSWNDFKTKKASKKKRLDNMSSGVFKKKSMFSGVGEGVREVSKLTVPKKHQFHST
jgi:hypothetical protein